ncbi:MAG: hypothetical protein GX802_05400 [Clostridiales bacterium]|jgi:hypothetical protein|nr:hypothetical protein [Clostridiales bacterium]
MRNKDFTVFILTHGRPDNVITYKTLRYQGYTGPIYLVVDNEDGKLDKYIENFGIDNVIVFDKKKYADSVDEGNNFDERRTITHARNACFDIADKLGFTYFMELDDDYIAFIFRTNNKKEYPTGFFLIRTLLDSIFDLLIEFYKKIPALSVAMAQGGDFIGGSDSDMAKNMPLKRKCMNSFICSTKRRFKFVGAMNEDVNTYTTLGSRGALFFTIPFVSLTQESTQSQEGGITDMYLIYGTYCKSFTTVMMMPSAVKVSMMQSKYERLHHKISWNNCVPKIINESIKKE